MRTIISTPVALAAGLLVGAHLHWAASAAPACPPGLPASGHHVLLRMTGGGITATADSAIFRAKPPFTLRYQAHLSDTTTPGTLSVTIQNRGNSVTDLAINGEVLAKGTIGTMADQADDCSAGCFLHAESLNVSYTLQMEQ